MPESYYSDANCLTSKEVQFRRVNPCKWTSLPRQQDLVSFISRLLLSRSEKKTGDCFRLRIVYLTRKLFKFRIFLKLLLPENRDVLAGSRTKLDISSCFSICLPTLLEKSFRPRNGRENWTLDDLLGVRFNLSGRGFRSR